MSESYYTLLTRNDGAPWAIEFGDYDRDCVEFERDDIKWRCISLSEKAPKFKIIKTSDRQSDIRARVDALNGAQSALDSLPTETLVVLIDANLKKFERATKRQA